jgi:phage-related baseplate assembly protein
MAEETFFELPTDPEEFGVVLEPAKLRRIDFSALEFQEIRRATIEYIKTYYPTLFNDFVANNGIIMITELVSYIGGLLSQRSDIIADESFLPTAQTEDAVSQHLALINNEINRATPAVIDVEISIDSEAPTPINIPAGVQFRIVGADGLPLTYELYRAPGDFISPITIFPGTRGIIGFGIEGRFIAPLVAESAGGPNQEFEILESNILTSPIAVDITTGNTTAAWTQIDTLERAGPNDEVFEVLFFEDRAIVRFGNDVAGKALLAGQVATVRFRVGGGIRGRIAANAINETRPINPEAPASASVEVLFRNPNPSSGGTDKESLDAARLRAPKESAALSSATSGEDYSVQARGFTHPIFGSVLKAVASLKTSLNANIVFLHVLAAGPDDIPVLPSLGLKQSLQTYFGDLKVLTDEVRIEDGAIKPVDVRANVVISRSADPAQVRVEVDSRLKEFFSVDNFDMGQPLYQAQIYELLQSIEGVKFVQLREPVDDILMSKEGAVTANDNQVGFDELITLGSVNVKLYFEKI